MGPIGLPENRSGGGRAGKTAQPGKCATARELGSIKDRLASVEKIVVDDSHHLTSEIEALRGSTN